ncbi:MAG: hypothetical protein Ct9H90mP3_4650 [Flammeovirgaceae bacterium]|nr:MAG: hypothetical protein Ct9H90mP3_4650 [Flammeovirgaceae bacterium]
MKVKTKFLKIISDIHTPVGVYLKLRDLYSKVFFFESSDYKGSENSFHLFVLTPKLKFQSIMIL